MDPACDGGLGISERYSALLAALEEAYCVVAVRFDDHDQPCDYQFLEVNAAFSRLTGLVDPVGHWMKELAPAHEPHWFTLYGEVARTGTPARFQNYAAALGERWYDVLAYRVDAPELHHVAILFSDVTATLMAGAERDAARIREEEARALVDALYEAAPIGLAFLDRDLRFRQINSRLAEMNGLPVAAHIGKRPDELLGKLEGLEGILARWREVLTSGTPWLGVEIRGETPAQPGVVRTWIENFFPVRVGDRIVGLGVVADETTERRRAELALAASESRLRSLIELSPVGIAIAEADGRVVLANEAFLTLLGYGRDEGELPNWKERTPPEQLAQDMERIERLHRGEAPEPFEKEFVRRDGSVVSALVVAQFLQGESGRMVAFAVDNTTRKQTERQLRENEARLHESALALQEADRRKDVFLATLAHELRNPLAPLRNAVEILRLLSAGNATFERTTQMMERQVRHLVRLVDDLLDISRITRGKIDLRREPVVLNDVVTSALEFCGGLFGPNSHELRVEIPPEPLTVLGDADRLRQVFSNLLSNAAKFTPRPGTIWVQLERRGTDARVRVRDNGIGIPAERLHSVFEMFAQGPDARSNDGLGIGLALARQLVQLQGGTVHAESDGPGHGSQFTVCLPLAPAAPGERANEATRPEVQAVRARRILVVDDNVDAAETLQQMLRLQGHEVDMCTSGEEAIAAVARDPPELIFMDIGMPDMDGLTAARRIRALPGGARVRIVALTGWGQERDRARTREAGIDAHLVKPVSQAQLASVLSEYP